MKLLLTSCDFTLSSSFCSALSPAGPLLLYPSAERAELSQCWGPGSASPLRHHPGERRTRAPALRSRACATQLREPEAGYPSSTLWSWQDPNQNRHAGPTDRKQCVPEAHREGNARDAVSRGKPGERLAAWRTGFFSGRLTHLSLPWPGRRCCLR